VSGRAKVLILDDSPLILEMTRAFLGDAGFDVLTALNLSELERVLDTEPPDVVLVDVNMPEAFGDDVAMVLRSARKVAAPIYLYSNLDVEELATRARDAEVEGFISKRQGFPVLVERLQQILAVKQAHS